MSVTKVAETIRSRVASTGTTRKAQNLGAAGANPFQGALNFGNDTNNPLDAGFGFANAALGIFSSYGQQAKIVDGELHLRQRRRVPAGQLEGERAADARLRTSLRPSEAAARRLLQASNFFPDRWSASEAPLLYTAGLPERRASVSRRLPRGHESGHGGVARARQVAPRRHGRARHGRHQRDNAERSGHREGKPHLAGALVAPRFGAAYVLTDDQQVVSRQCRGVLRPARWQTASTGRSATRPRPRDHAAVLDAAGAAPGEARRPRRRPSCRS